MFRLYVPVAVTVVLIASLTFWESVYSDRFTGSSMDAAEFGKRFANVPKEVGPWIGTDNEVSEETLQAAGAVNHVSRTYANRDTGQKVDLWLIVGHARDIVRHTPDICYPSNGFAQDGTAQKQSIEAEDGSSSMFNTARFRQESILGDGGPIRRVFWAWNANKPDEKEWVAPESQRVYFGNNTALYKMYFTSSMNDRDELVMDNNAVAFAKVMIPEVNKALFPELYPAASPSSNDENEPAEAETTATEPDSAASVETPAAG
jgi:hypothetical protein